ncbi:META domain-containing protein [Methanoregula sp. UBA64]|jgi:heat shock protein HslJ|uniref:META domain-containing protein n=1 Tax=Methanoregula sp. UBA64 TaxID=1915554 RepID=UPI0025FADBB5|nr:META domain-containing protein [Methanoregula sp. UBA64]
MDEAEAPKVRSITTTLLTLALAGIAIVVVLVFFQGMTAQPQVLQASPNWTLVSCRDATGILIPAINNGEVTAQFNRDGNITGFSGCNRYVAAFIKNNDRIRITYPLHTDNTCSDAGLMQQEASLYRNLAAAASVNTGPSELDLLDANGATLLKFHRQ